jgi:hypothetical protein
MVAIVVCCLVGLIYLLTNEMEKLDNRVKKLEEENKGE